MSAPDITAGARVLHRNACHSYGLGEVARVVPSFLRPPSKAYVRFDGEPADRLVWLDDLTPTTVPAPVLGGARIVWPLERAGEPVFPGVA